MNVTKSLENVLEGVRITGMDQSVRTPAPVVTSVMKMGSVLMEVVDRQLQVRKQFVFAYIARC